MPANNINFVTSLIIFLKNRSAVGMSRPAPGMNPIVLPVEASAPVAVTTPRRTPLESLMKRLNSVLAPTLMSCLLIAASARAATVYRDTVKGFESASGESDSVNLLLTAEGDLPGMGHVSLRRDGDKVVGGVWRLTVLADDADPTAGEKGGLVGSVGGGTMTFNGDGSLAKAESVRLTVESGTGRYSRVGSGSGLIHVAPAADNPSQLVGSLTLTF
jgi:hypothetical protein